MPLFLYQHPETEEVVEIIQSVHDVHEYIKDGIKYNRIFTVPQASIDTKINPWDKKKFIEKTGKSKGTMGDLYDRSRDMSEQRMNKSGTDDIKLAFKKKYESERKGKKIPVRCGSQEFTDRM